jgi:hypothetical protein
VVDVRRRGRAELPGSLLPRRADHIHKLNPGTVATVTPVVYLCLMQQLLLELPLLGYLFAPDRTQAA